MVIFYLSYSVTRGCSTKCMYILYNLTGVAPDNVSQTKCVVIENMARGLPQRVWGYKIWQGGCHILYPLPYSASPLQHFVSPSIV